MEERTLLTLPLQFFAEDENDLLDDDLQEEIEEELEEADPAESEPLEDEPPEPATFKVKFYGQEQELTAEELVTHAQKGMNYDHVHAELEQLRREKAQYAAEQAHKTELMRVLNAFGYQGTDEDIIAALAAEAHKITPEQYKAQRQAEMQAIEQRIQNDPRVRQAQQMSERMAVQAAMQRDFAIIKAAFPDDPGADMNTIRGGGEVAELICKGIDPVKAYRVVNHDTLARKPKPPTGNDKAHLIKAGGASGGAGLADIPTAEKGMWADAFPDDTPAQLKERYNRTIKRQGD